MPTRFKLARVLWMHADKIQNSVVPHVSLGGKGVVIWSTFFRYVISIDTSPPDATGTTAGSHGGKGAILTAILFGRR